MQPIALPTTVDTGSVTLTIILAVCVYSGLQLATTVTKNIMVPLVKRALKLNGYGTSSQSSKEVSDPELANQSLSILKTLIQELHEYSETFKETNLALKQIAEGMKAVGEGQVRHENTLVVVNSKLDLMQERILAPHG